MLQRLSLAVFAATLFFSLNNSSFAKLLNEENYISAERSQEKNKIIFKKNFTLAQMRFSPFHATSGVFETLLERGSRRSGARIRKGGRSGRKMFRNGG